MGNKASTAALEVKGKDLTGKHIIVTGSSGGIGEETVKALYYSGATVVMASRNKTKMDEASKRILSIGEENTQATFDLNDKKGELHIMELDLADLSSVSKFATEYKQRFNRLHILINNAGQMACPLARTTDGFETQIGINHLGHFALTLQLLELMKETANNENTQGRIVNVSSMGHKMGAIDLDDLNYEKRSYSAFSAYGQSKLANILFTKELYKRLKADNVNITVNSLHPGVIKTDLGRNSTTSKIYYAVATPFLKSIAQGAATTVYCAVSEELNDKGGLFCSDCAELEPNSYAKDMTVAAGLFDLSEKLTHVQYPFGTQQQQEPQQQE